MLGTGRTRSKFFIITVGTSELSAFRAFKALGNCDKASADMAFLYLLGLVFVLDNCGVARNIGFFFVADYIARNHVLVSHSKAR